MAKMRQPINVSEGLELANSLIEGTEWKQNVVNFKARRGWMQFTSDRKKKHTLGKKWYNGFWKRHGHKVEKKKVKSSPRIALNGQCTETLNRCMIKCMTGWNMLGLH
jgi:hypothetical protein